MKRLWEWLRGLVSTRGQESDADRPRSDRPTEVQLEAMSLTTGWKQAAEAVSDDLGANWFEEPHPERPVQPFVAPPGCSFDQWVPWLASERQVRMLRAPSPDEVLQASRSAAPELPGLEASASDVLVIPKLEQWYLRHEDGLALVRTLLDRLTHTKQRVIVGCDSWAWAFLQGAIGVEDILGEAKTLAPFDANRMDTLLRTMLDFDRFDFRQSAKMEPVFPPAAAVDPEAAGRAEVPVADVIRNLAANARGNPAVALAIWRALLRTHPADAKGAAASTSSPSRSILWVDPPSEWTLPRLPQDMDRIDRYLIHALLLHGGLARPILPMLLPFPTDELQRRLAALRRVGIIETRCEMLHVALTAYPLVRRDLQSADFLVDGI